MSDELMSRLRGIRSVVLADTSEDVPSARLRKLGELIARDPTISIGVESTDKMRIDLLEAHALVVGQSRRGKSKALELMMRQLLIEGAGLTVVDPHGSLAREVVAWLAHPETVLPSKQRVHVLRPADRARTFGMNMLRTRDNSAEEIARVAHVCQETIAAASGLESKEAPRLSKLLEGIFTVLASAGEPLTSAQFMVFVEQKDVRDYLLQSLSNEFHLNMWRDLEALVSGRNKKPYIEYMESVVSRLMPFSNPVVSRIIGQVHGLDPLLVMERGDVVLLDLSGLADTDAKLIGRLFTASYLSSAKLREPGKGKRHYLFIDEADVFLQGNRDLAQIVDQGAKYGLSLICSLQRLSQAREADEYVYGALMNCAVKLVFGIGDPEDAKLLADVLFVHEIGEPIRHSIRREVINTRLVWRRSHSSSKGEALGAGIGSAQSETHGTSKAVGRSTSKGESESFGTGKSHGTMQAESEGWGRSHGRTEGRSVTDSENWSTGENWSDGRSIGDSQNWSHADSVGTSSGITEGLNWGESTSTGTSESITNGSSFGESIGTSSGISHSEMFLPMPEEEEYLFSFLAPPPPEPTQTGFSDGMSQGVSQSSSMGSSTAMTSGSSASSGQSTGGSIARSNAESLSASDSFGGGRSSALSSSEGGSFSYGGGHSEGYSESESFSDSISGGVARGVSDSVSETHSRGMSTSATDSFSVGESSGRGSTTSRSQMQARSRTSGETWTEAEENVYGSYYSQFYSLEDQRYRRQALLQNLARRHCVLKVEGMKAIITKTRDVIEHFTSVTHKAECFETYVAQAFEKSEFSLSVAQAEANLLARRKELFAKAGRAGDAIPHDQPPAGAWEELPSASLLQLVGAREKIRFGEKGTNAQTIACVLDSDVSINSVCGRNRSIAKEGKVEHARIEVEIEGHMYVLTGPVVKRTKNTGVGDVAKNVPVVSIAVSLSAVHDTVSFVLVDVDQDCAKVAAPLTQGICIGASFLNGRFRVDSAKEYLLDGAV